MFSIFYNSALPIKNIELYEIKSLELFESTHLIAGGLYV